MVVLGLVTVLTTIALVAGGVGSVMVAHRKAQAAADLAALAGAADLRDGRDGCVLAARIAAANGAVLADCLVDGVEVEVVVAVAVPAVPGAPTMRSRARAGPSANVAEYPRDFDP